MSDLSQQPARDGDVDRIDVADWIEAAGESATDLELPARHLARPLDLS